MTNPPKGTTVDTTNLQPGELLQMYFTLYNFTSIQCFTYIITVLYENIIMRWVFPNSYKRAPVRIICFILTKLKNKNIHSDV